MQTLADQLEANPGLTRMVIPDLWQQDAVAGLREGKDVVVHAPTGAGKTLIFELWSNNGKPRGQAIYTVPTRALANDKLAEWRGRGWDVGIATGDLAENLHAPVLVATLETQKRRLIEGDGPSLLVVDEYQMIGDPDRGLNYELAIALAPPKTQLLLLSGSVGNPDSVVRWLKRIGREAVLVKYEKRPVPLDEVWANQLNYAVPTEIRGYWPRLVAKCLAEDLGPILIFAPRRQATEELAAELARHLPNPHPLTLNQDQKQLVGEHLARMLKGRVSYHHSGLSYAARAGVIEPLAKAGQLRVVVATMGLAAGINFSLRSVALAGDSYRRDQVEQPLRADELLQMWGRAGRRGIDETGYVLITANELRLRDGYPCQLSRSGLVDWSALLGVMSAAARAGKDPFAEAVIVQQRLFTTRPIFLGVEQSMAYADAPCGLRTDSERARHVRRRVREMLNSHGEWEPYPKHLDVALKDIFMVEVAGSTHGTAVPAVPAVTNQETHDLKPCEAIPQLSQLHAETHMPEASATGLRSILTEPAALEKVGAGNLVQIGEQDGLPVYGRSITVADKIHDGRIVLVKWIRKLTNWQGRQASSDLWKSHIAPLVERRLAKQGLNVIRFDTQEFRIFAVVSLEEQRLRVPVDRHGIALWRPEERNVMAAECAGCSQMSICEKLPTSTGTALLWRRMGLVDERGVPTRRGQIASYFHAGDGLAIAAALEDESYPLDELLYDLANLDASFRFCGDDNRWGGRLGMASQRAFGLQRIPGYLENGVPPKYGAGAEHVVASVHKDPFSKFGWVTEFLGIGDIDRVIIEWRSLLRQVVHAPTLDWPRWIQFKALAKSVLNETESPTLTDLPPLEYSQTSRVGHKLILRRH